MSIRLRPSEGSAIQQADIDGRPVVLGTDPRGLVVSFNATGGSHVITLHASTRLGLPITLLDVDNHPSTQTEKASTIFDQWLQEGITNRVRNCSNISLTLTLQVVLLGASFFFLGRKTGQRPDLPLAVFSLALGSSALLGWCVKQKLVWPQ